jgi:diadenosine tetraphosphate (Ap4A) HIT family hydrolase
MFTPEQARLVKRQLIEQIDRWDIDEQSKSNAKSYILKLGEEKLEEFLKKNKLLKDEPTKEEIPKQPIPEERKEERKNNCVFCLIAEGKIPSYKVDENETSLAVLEVKPLSKGHIIIIPKKHVSLNQTPVSSFSLAKEVAKRIKKILKPKEISISTSLSFGHEIVNVIPSYEGEINERKDGKKEELEGIQKLLVKEKLKVRKKKMEKEIKSEPKLYHFPRRIP